MKRRIYIFIFLILNYLASYSQTSDSTKQIESMNVGIDYLNETITTLSLIHRDLEEYNMLLNSYYVDKTFEVNNRAREQLKSNSDYNFNIKKCSEHFKTQCNKFPPGLSLKITTNITEILDILARIKSNRDELALYIKNQEFMGDPALIHGYAILQDCATLFERFDYHKEQIVSTLEIMTAMLQTLNPRNPFVRSVSAFNDLLSSSKIVLKSVKRGNENIIRSFNTRLLNNIETCTKNKNNNLAGIESDKSENDPYYRYDNIIDEAKAIYLFADTYLKTDSISKKECENGKEYFFYNQRLLKKYNQQEQGVVYYYNLFIGQSSVLFLKTTSETNWFVVCYPPNWKKSTQKGHKPEKEPKKEEVVIEEPKTEEPKIEEDTIPDTKSMRGHPAANLIFLLDVSGSMREPEKLPVLKDAFKQLVTVMRPRDYVAIVSYSGSAKIELNSVSSSKDALIFNSIDSVKSGGGSNVVKGLKLSYELALDNFINYGNNRIILATDGGFDVTRKVYNTVEKYASKDIHLTIFYLGKVEDSRKAVHLRKLAKIGKGNYRHIKKADASEILLQEAQSKE